MLETCTVENQTGIINEISLINADDASIPDDILSMDRDIALRDLKHNNVFQPIGDANGPYKLELYIEENKLIFHLQNKNGEDLPYLVLSLTPYRRLIKDYFMIVRSYDEAVRAGNPVKVEAIDMGRRGLHNEGAELLQERLKEKIDVDMDTARRIFTLICVLHNGKTHTLR